MRSGLIAKKIGNSSYFDDNGLCTNVTVLKVEDCVVSEIKNEEKHGYDAVQLASIDSKSKNNKIKKPQKKFFITAKIENKKVLKEFRVDKNNILDVGSKLTVSHFEKDQFIDVTALSIGKGFAGVMKRHNFAGLRASHGVSISHRSHGSTGQNQDPGRVFKGKKMAGHMGNKKVTKQNLKVLDVDSQNQLLIIKGSIPGKKNSIVYLKDSIKK